MAADVGKVYPTEIHLLKKEIEVQGELLSQEQLERREETERLRLEMEAFRKKKEPQRSEQMTLRPMREDRFTYEPGFIVGQWPNWVRLVSAASGMVLLGLALKKRGVTGIVSSALGTALLSRALTNRDLTQLIGTLILPVLSLSRSQFVAAPIEEVYEFLKDFSNYPKFMSFIENVTINEMGTLTWTAKAPGGTRVQWHTAVLALQPNQKIAWKSIPGSLIATEGTMQMRPREFGTELEIHLSYAPPVGALGYVFGHILGFDPRNKIDEDLKVLVRLIEEGRGQSRIHT